MSELIEKVNAGVGQLVEIPVTPVMATPAAFYAGVVVGAKVAAVLAGSAAVGVALAAK